MSRSASLKAIAALGDEMLAAAKASDWETLRGLEERERTLAEQLPATPFQTPQEQAEQKRLLELILERHAAIQALIQPLHQDLKILLEAFPEASGTEK